MTVITGIELDTEQRSSTPEDWSLYFTGGEYQGINVKRIVSPSILYLKKSKYRDCRGINPCLFYLYYNPKNDQYNLINSNEDIDACNDYGYMIGGFQVKDCQMTFVYASSSENCQYKRIFDNSYNDGFEHTEVYCSDCPDQGIFDIDMFTDAFQTECVIQETPNGENGCGQFRKVQFTEDYLIKDCPPDGSSTGSGAGGRCCTAFPDN
jgi:hypothetical protein